MRALVTKSIDRALAAHPGGQVQVVRVGYGDWARFCQEVGEEASTARVLYRGRTVERDDHARGLTLIVEASLH